LADNGAKFNEVSIKLNIGIINIYFVRLREWLRTKLYLDFSFIFIFIFIYIILIIFFDLKNIIIVFTKISEPIRARPFARFYLNELTASPPSPK